MAESGYVSSMEAISTLLFAAAILHTFAAKKISSIGHKYRDGSVPENLFHFLGEVEVVFGLWAAIFVVTWAFRFGAEPAISFVNSINFTEPAFVFVIMCMSATKPVMNLARSLIANLAKVIPLQNRIAFFLVIMICGPLLGSLITEPAAMTVTALLLKEKFFDHKMSPSFRYSALGLLFVSVSLGGTLTHFAAPPVLMVAAKWQWDTMFMIENFGWRAVATIAIATISTAAVFRKEIMVAVSDADSPNRDEGGSNGAAVVWWVSGVHVFFMILTILSSHHMVIFMSLFLFFLGWCSVTKEYQEELRFRESLLVAFFLGGLVVLGNLQSWWLKPLIENLDGRLLFWGATFLTAITDNAALTYLGSLVPTLGPEAKLALVSGAVAGGGLTVIANAPNPAGYGILRSSFGADGISPLGLFVGALPPTLLYAILFQL